MDERVIINKLFSLYTNCNHRNQNKYNGIRIHKKFDIQATGAIKYFHIFKVLWLVCKHLNWIEMDP